MTVDVLVDEIAPKSPHGSETESILDIGAAEDAAAELPGRDVGWRTNGVKSDEGACCTAGELAPLSVAAPDRPECVTGGFNGALVPESNRSQNAP